MQHCNFFCLRLLYNRLVLFTLLIIAIKGNTQTFPVDTIQNYGAASNRIMLAYLSDGYTTSELNTFVTDVQGINTGLFAQSPFKEYQYFFNAYSIKVPSVASGAIHPANASDESSSGGQPIANPSNYFKSTFDYGSIHRLLVPTNYSGLSNILAANIPGYDQAFIVVNSPYYGGSGGGYATSSTNISSTEIAIHEIGHSFAGLADEYWAGAGYAAEKPNMTQTNNPTTVKWSKWYGIYSTGIYPYGTTSPMNSWYRPHQFCKMQYLNYPFCPVCTQTFIDRIHQLVNMIDSYSPSSTSFNLTNTNPVSLYVTNLQTTTNTIKVNWYLNGNTKAFATNKFSVTIPFATLINGNNTITVEVIDTISLSKSYLPAAAGYINSVTWTVYKAPSLPIDIISFIGKTDENNQALLSWEVSNNEQIKSYDLEKSDGNNDFKSLVELRADSGKNKYTYTDSRMYIPDSYYRLRLTGKDGSYNYSNVIKLTNPFNSFNYKITQNTATHLYHLSCKLNTSQHVSLSILTMGGQEVYRKDFGLINNLLEQDINLSNKPAGIYIARIQIGNRDYSVKLSAD